MRRSSRGNLKVPKDAKIIIDGEPAIVARTKRKLTPLFQKSPDNPKKLVCSDKLPKDTEILVRAFACSPISNPNLRIIHPHYAEAALFKRVGNKRADMPESGNEIRIIKKGFIYHRDIKISSETYKRFKENIFPHTPIIEDIRQAQMGDCFLLGALIAILKRPGGTNFIMNNMRQYDKFTIIKLFNPRTCEPIYVKVENTYHYRNGNSAVNHHAPWVHLIEKAFASLGFKPISKDKPTREHKSFLTIYGEGGDSSFAMTVLTGIKADNKAIHTLKVHPWDSEHSSYIWPYAAAYDEAKDKDQESLATVVEQLDAAIEKLKVEEVSIYLALKDDDQDKTRELFLAWGRYICELRRDHREFYDKQFKPRVLYQSQTQLNRPESLTVVAFLNECKHPAPIEITQKFRDFIYGKTDPSDENPYRYCGELFTGTYTPTQGKIYENFEDNLKQGHIITAGTLNEFPEGKTVSGLRSKHNYAVIGVVEKEKNGYPVKFIRLVNPWGNTGRIYNDNTQLPSEDERRGVFDIELSDFTKYFSSYYIGQLPKSISPAEENQKEKIARLTEFKERNKFCEQYKLNNYERLLHRLIKTTTKQLLELDNRLEEINKDRSTNCDAKFVSPSPQLTQLWSGFWPKLPLQFPKSIDRLKRNLKKIEDTFTDLNYRKQTKGWVFNAAQAFNIVIQEEMQKLNANSASNNDTQLTDVTIKCFGQLLSLTQQLRKPKEYSDRHALSFKLKQTGNDSKKPMRHDKEKEKEKEKENTSLKAKH